jgi:hypothetical protein
VRVLFFGLNERQRGPDHVGTLGRNQHTLIGIDNLSFYDQRLLTNRFVCWPDARCGRFGIRSVDAEDARRKLMHWRKPQAFIAKFAT